ncbi:11-beta-hydroxysteroid dehydrogenase-like 2 [Holothuria leucospilota]|uniref:11-beta-hydroxysteroid dehydrogenase-like 2 n=1 Tax=Holothuria leucospilota TaxID=206669 RepID=A0A9Q1BIV6_HOLLE|nr:11-beta-hydroxysteroid dehydrogenase-like 2 [Holothuria leucospilota]
MDLKGKVAIITGASSGLGKATAVMFSKLGANVALAGRNAENLNKTKLECEKHGAKVLLVPGDVTNEEDNIHLVKQTVEQFEKLDILVNNAGILKVGSIETTSMADFDISMTVNLRSVFQLTQLAVPHLTKTKGCIVNVSTVGGMRSVCNSYGIYQVSKYHWVLCV